MSKTISTMQRLHSEKCQSFTSAVCSENQTRFIGSK